MRKNFEADVKVGLFVSFGVGLTMLAILLLSGPKHLFSKSVSYTAHFAQGEGLIGGAKVILNGLAVGAVDSIELDPKRRQVEVQFTVSEKAGEWIREGTTVEIATQGVLGDKYLSLAAGPEDQPILPPHSDIPHRPSTNLTQFLSQSDKLMTSMNQIAIHLDHLMRVFEADNRSERFFKGLASTSFQLAQLTEKLNKELDHSKLNHTLTQLNSIVEKINNGTGTIGALINDPTLYDNLNSIVGGASRNRVIRNLVRQTMKEPKKEE